MLSNDTGEGPTIAGQSLGARVARFVRRLSAATTMPLDPAKKPTTVQWMFAHRDRILDILPFVFYGIVSGSVCLYFLTSTWDSPGADGSLYREGAAAWLAGIDPWSVGPSKAHFSGAPSTILAYVPTALIPDAVWRPISFVLDIGLAVVILRRLKLGWWWLAYPPLTIAIFLGQPGVIVLGLLLLGGAWFAPAIKVYALVPLVVARRWKTALAGVAIIAATFALAPALWLEYLRQLPALTERLYAELHDSPNIPLSITAAVAFLVVWRLSPRIAPWLAIAALWPTWEYHYAIYSLPTLNPVLLFAETALEGRVVVVAYAAWLIAKVAVRGYIAAETARPPAVASGSSLGGRT
jgi:hypothetical protein